MSGVSTRASTHERWSGTASLAADRYADRLSAVDAPIGKKSLCNQRALPAKFAGLPAAQTEQDPEAITGSSPSRAAEVRRAPVGGCLPPTMSEIAFAFGALPSKKFRLAHYSRNTFAED